MVVEKGKKCSSLYLMQAKVIDSSINDRNFSIVPKYLAFLRSNSGQEKLEKESLRLL